MPGCSCARRRGLCHCQRRTHRPSQAAASKLSWRWIGSVLSFDLNFRLQTIVNIEKSLTSNPADLSLMRVNRSHCRRWGCLWLCASAMASAAWADDDAIGEWMSRHGGRTAAPVAAQKGRFAAPGRDAAADLVIAAMNFLD